MRENLQIGSYEYYERLYEVEERHWWYMGIREAASWILNAQYQGVSGLNILDAGCGTGFTLTWLERYSLPKRAVGIDLSWNAFQFCRRRGQRLLSQASVLELPLENHFFDLVVCKAVVQHLRGSESDKLALREFYRVLKPGGCLLLITRSSSRMVEGKKPANYRAYSLDEVRDRIQEAGFDVIKLTCTNILGSIIHTIKWYLTHGKDHVYHNVGLPRRPQPHLEWLNKLLYWVMKSEAWFLFKFSITLPFGQTIFCLAQRPESSHQGQQLSAHVTHS